MPPVISFSGISKRFGNNTVLSNVDLDIRKNELFGIVGRSGSGKSTLLKTLTGFYRPTGGKIYFNGKDITKESKSLKRVIGFATQDNAFYYNLSIFENMKYYCRIYGMKGDLDEYIHGLLRSVQLGRYEHSMAGNLSDGMKRRLDLAISVVHDPDIVVMDEPTAGLDPILRKDIWGTIRTINDMGKTIIVTSHMFDEIIYNCNRACVISNGSVKRIFDLNELRRTMDINSLAHELEKCMEDGDIN